jgi:hypothetical protein
LSQINLDLAAQAQVPFYLNCNLNTKAPGKLICPSDKHCDVRNTASANINPSTVKAEIHYARKNDTTVSIVFDIHPVLINTAVTPAPLNQINSVLFSFFDCSFLSQQIHGKTISASIGFTKSLIALLNINNNLEKLILDGQYSFDTPQYSLSLPVICKPIKLLQKQIRLNPIVETGYIGFSAN